MASKKDVFEFLNDWVKARSSVGPKALQALVDVFELKPAEAKRALDEWAMQFKSDDDKKEERLGKLNNLSILKEKYKNRKRRFTEAKKYSETELNQKKREAEAVLKLTKDWFAAFKKKDKASAKRILKEIKRKYDTLIKFAYGPLENEKDSGDDYGRRYAVRLNTVYNFIVYDVAHAVVGVGDRLSDIGLTSKDAESFKK